MSIWDTLAVVAIILCGILRVTEYKRRRAARLPATLGAAIPLNIVPAAVDELAAIAPPVRPPILNAELATHLAIPPNERLPQFPAPIPTDLARLDVGPFESLCGPVPSPALGSPILLLSPRQRQNAHHRLAHDTTTPALDTPPGSPALDSMQRPMSPLHSPLFISRLNAGPPRSPLAADSPSPRAMTGLGLGLGLKPALCQEPSSSEEPRMCPEILALPPAPVRTVVESLPPTPPVRPCPSLVATPLSVIPEASESLSPRDVPIPSTRKRTFVACTDPPVTPHNTSSRIPLATLHNKNLAALISPTKATKKRRMDGGANPVYEYQPQAPAVAIDQEVARGAQDEFKVFSVALGEKFERNGWGKRVKKRKNNKRNKVAPAPSLLPAFEPAARVDEACRPDCGDIYCGGCK